MRFFLACAALLLFCAPVLAEEAQRWGQLEEESAIASAGGALPLEDFSSEIYFDPTMLSESSIILSTILRPQGEPATDDNIYSGTFQSTRIRQVKGNLFEAEGKFMADGAERIVKIPFTASFDKSSQTPKIILEGGFDVNPAEYGASADTAKYPAQVPLRFRIAAIPIPQ